MRKWGKYLPVVTLLFPGGLFIVGAWLAVEFIRRGDNLAEIYRKGLAHNCKRQEEDASGCHEVLRSTSF